MTTKIVIEIILAASSFFVGSNLWTVVRTPRHLRLVLNDPGEIAFILNSIEIGNLITEAKKVEPVFGSYSDNILVFIKSHLDSLDKTRNILIVASVVIFVASIFIGIWYFVINVILFILPLAYGIPVSGKNANANLIHTMMLNILQWHYKDPTSCRSFCTNDKTYFRAIHQVITSRLTSD